MVGARQRSDPWGSAIRDCHDGDTQRAPLRPAMTCEPDEIRRWMHDTAVACTESTVADDLTHLFGHASCSICGTVCNVANWFEAENSPVQPIGPIAPRNDRSM